MIELEALPGGSGRQPRIPLADIDPEVVSAVDEAFAYNAENPTDRLSAKFASQEDAEAFLREARSYAYHREAGRLVVSGNAVASGHARFRVFAYGAPAEG
jgi:hypothetical protein